jgi:hypothetical protein
MDKFLEFVVDKVFSFGMFMFLFGTAVLILLGSIAVASDKAREQTQLRVEACYAQGMVLVRTDAGQRCVLPQSLVKVK